jgi:hypothetical protein
MVEREEKLVFQLTEELRELAYLDSLELLDRPPSRSRALHQREILVASPSSRSGCTWSRRASLPSRRRTLGEDVLGLLKEADGEYVSDFSRDRALGSPKSTLWF